MSESVSEEKETNPDAEKEREEQDRDTFDKYIEKKINKEYHEKRAEEQRRFEDDNRFHADMGAIEQRIFE